MEAVAARSGRRAVIFRGVPLQAVVVGQSIINQEYAIHHFCERQVCIAGIGNPCWVPGIVGQLVGLPRPVEKIGPAAVEVLYGGLVAIGTIVAGQY